RGFLNMSAANKNSPEGLFPRSRLVALSAELLAFCFVAVAALHGTARIGRLEGERSDRFAALRAGPVALEHLFRAVGVWCHDVYVYLLMAFSPGSTTVRYWHPPLT